MKNILFAISILTIFCFAKCKKDKTDFNGLPPATQSGKNTLGFLLNGQPWTPVGYNGGTSNLSISVDFAYRNGGFNIAAYQISSYISENQSFGIGIADSLNYISIPAYFNIGQKSLYGIYFSNNTCTYDFFSTSIFRKGSLVITKLDKAQRIISGTFNATLYKAGCDTIRITDGRFDMKY